MSDATQTGASISDRIESFLLAQDSPQGAETPPDKSEPEEVNDTPEVEAKSEDKPEITEEGDEGEQTKDAVEKESAQLSVDDIAAALGIESDKLDVDEDGNLYMKTKVDGIEGKAKHADLLKSYQLEGHLNKRNMEVAEKQKAIDAKLAEIDTQAKAKVEQLDAYVKMNQGQLNHEYSSVNWQELRASDPGEYSAKMAEFQIRQAQINEALNFVEHQKGEVKTQREQRERARLVEVLPEWKDEAVASKERTEIASYVKSKGISPEIADYADGVSLLRKAMMFDKMQSARPEIEKKVRIAPKLVKPGQAQTKAERAGVDRAQLKQAVKNGKMSAAEWLLKTNRV